MIASSGAPSSQPIFVITGTPGAGKPAVAQALARRFPFGLHIPVDDLRAWVVSGIAHPVPTWTDETSRQFGLARQAAALTARLYADAGFVVAIDDVIKPAEAEELIAAHLSGYLVARILLHPALDVVLARNARRTTKNFDTSTFAQFIPGIHQWIVEDRFDETGWLIVDSAGMSLDGTVDYILEHRTISAG